jgi:hypothetical protein
MLVRLSAPCPPIAGVHAPWKQRCRRIIVELDDEREHQADEIAVLCAEVEAENAANLFLIRLFTAPARNVAQGTGLGGVDRLAGLVIGWGYGNRSECNGGGTAIDRVARWFVAYPGVSELLKLAQQLHPSEGAEGSGFVHQFGASRVDPGENKGRRTRRNGRVSDESCLGTVVSGGVCFCGRLSGDGFEVSRVEVGDVQSVVVKALRKIPGAFLIGHLGLTGRTK